MRLFCLGCDLIKPELGVFKQKICHDCLNYLDKEEPIYINIVSNDNLWFGKLLAVGPYSGIHRNLLFHAKVHRNPFAVKFIKKWSLKKLYPKIHKQKIHNVTTIKQSLWSIVTLRPNIANTIQHTLINNKTTTHITDPRKRNIRKRSFEKKSGYIVHKDQVGWEALNHGKHIIFDDILSTGKTIDDTICELRDFSSKLIVLWACHPRFLSKRHHLADNSLLRSKTL